MGTNSRIEFKTLTVLEIELFADSLSRYFIYNFRPQRVEDRF